MVLFKKKRSEKSVVHDVLRGTILKEKTNWPTTYAALKESCANLGNEFSVQDGLDEPWLDLSLAKIAMSLGQIENLYAAEQAARIRALFPQCIENLGTDTEVAGYMKEEFVAYERSFSQYATDFEAPHGSPVQAIAARLLHEWLGENLGVWEVELEGSKTGLVSPLLVLVVEAFLVPYAHVWKNVKDNFELVDA